MKAVLSSNVHTINSFVKTEHNKWDQLSYAKQIMNTVKWNCLRLAIVCFG